MTSSLKHVNHEIDSVQRLLRAARDLWTLHGYHGVSLHKIAAAAGVSKSLVHYHFESKEHLLLELQVDWGRRRLEDVQAHVAAASPSPLVAIEAIERFWDAMVGSRTEFPFRFELWRQSIANSAIRARLRADDAAARMLFCDGITSTLGPFAAHLALPLPQVAALIQTILDGIAVRLFIEDDVGAVRAIFDSAKALLTPALLRGSDPR